ncbi:hypothetical protein JCM17478_37340 [Thermopirellula anaerolimosa]
MCGDATMINRNTVAFQLNEALDAIRSAQRHEDPDPAIWVSLAEVVAHLCLAWHRRRLGPHELIKETQEQFEVKSTSVPNWGGQFRLVGFTASHPAIDRQSARGTIDQETVRAYLKAAEAALEGLMRDVLAGRFDSCDISVLEREFEKVLRNLCLAWHLRYLRSEEVASLDPMAIWELGYWLPPWQWNLRLVAPDQEV